MARGLPEHKWGPHSKGTPRDATSRPSRREPASSAASAVHVGYSGPDSSFRPEQPAATGSVLELAGGYSRGLPKGMCEGTGPDSPANGQNRPLTASGPADGARGSDPGALAVPGYESRGERGMARDPGRARRPAGPPSDEAPGATGSYPASRFPGSPSDFAREAVEFVPDGAGACMITML